MNHEDHVFEHGPLPTSDLAASGALIDAVARAGLRGRGGADFPTAVKLRSVREAGRRSLVVANGAEGEPCSAKDRVLLEAAPHLVLDGAALAAGAVGAREALVCVPEDADAALRSVAAAIDERPRGTRSSVRLRLRAVPHRFIAGEETALVNRLNGGPIKPTLVPPRPYQRGVDRRPTLVSNVETLAHLALIARHGDEWFRGLGTEAQPGSALITLSGPPRASRRGRGRHRRPARRRRRRGRWGHGRGRRRARRRLLRQLGTAGTTAGDHPRRRRLEPPRRRARGRGRLPAAVDACPVSETARVIGYLARESAGQCGPCTHGLAAIAGAWQRVASGQADGRDTERLARWCGQVRGRGACHHPDGAVRLVASALAGSPRRSTFT